MADRFGVSPSASKVDAIGASEARPATFGHLSFGVGSAQNQTTMDTESYGQHRQNSDSEKGLNKEGNAI